VTQPPDRPLIRTRLASVDLTATWEEHSAAFVAWARTPDHDSYWRFHRDLFLELVPPPGRRTLDLGCGEGRLSRDLKRLGHAVVGVDASETMIAAAREADPEIEIHRADAAELPFADATFDLVVSSLAIHNIRSNADRKRAIVEGFRVLKPGGRIVIADIRATAIYEEALRELGASNVERRRLGWRFWWGNPFASTTLLTASKAPA